MKNDSKRSVGVRDLARMRLTPGSEARWRNDVTPVRREMTLQHFVVLFYKRMLIGSLPAIIRTFMPNRPI